MAHLQNGYLVTETEWNAMDDRIATLETIDTGVHYTYKDSVVLNGQFDAYGIASINFPSNLGIPATGVIHCTVWNGDIINVPVFIVNLLTLSSTGLKVICRQPDGTPHTGNGRVNYTIAW